MTLAQGVCLECPHCRAIIDTATKEQLQLQLVERDRRYNNIKEMLRNNSAPMDPKILLALMERAGGI